MQLQCTVVFIVPPSPETMCCLNHLLCLTMINFMGTVVIINIIIIIFHSRSDLLPL